MVNNEFKPSFRFLFFLFLAFCLGLSRFDLMRLEWTGSSLEDEFHLEAGKSTISRMKLTYITWLVVWNMTFIFPYIGN